MFEFRLGSKSVEDGAEHLAELNKLIKEANNKNRAEISEPSFSAVITGGEIAYKRDDGVFVISNGNAVIFCRAFQRLI